MREDVSLLLIIIILVLIIIIGSIVILLLLNNNNNLKKIKSNIWRYIHFNKWMEQYVLLIEEQKSEIEKYKEIKEYQVKHIEVLEQEIRKLKLKNRYK